MVEYKLEMYQRLIADYMEFINQFDEEGGHYASASLRYCVDEVFRCRVKGAASIAMAEIAAVFDGVAQ